MEALSSLISFREWNLMLSLREAQRSFLNKLEFNKLEDLFNSFVSRTQRMKQNHKSEVRKELELQREEGGLVALPAVEDVSTFLILDL